MYPNIRTNIICMLSVNIRGAHSSICSLPSNHPSIYPSMQSCLKKALYIFRMLVQTHFIFMIHKFTSYQHEMTSFRRLKIQNVPFFPRTKSGREKKKGDRAMKSYSILDAIHIFPIISNVWIWTKINLNRMCVFAAYYLLCMWFNLRIMVNG